MHVTGCTAQVYLEYIQRNLPEGVAMEVTKVRPWRIRGRTATSPINSSELFCFFHVRPPWREFQIISKNPCGRTTPLKTNPANKSQNVYSFIQMTYSCKNKMYKHRNTVCCPFYSLFKIFCMFNFNALIV